MKAEAIEIFDRVRIRSTPLTQEKGLADLIGTVYGMTKPSVTQERENIGDIIGELKEDLAYAVNFDEDDEPLWFSSDLIIFVDHNPGTVATIGDQEMIKLDSGEWQQVDGKKTGFLNVLRRFLGLD